MIVDKEPLQINNFFVSPPASADKIKYSQSGEIGLRKLPKLSSPTHLMNFAKSESGLTKPILDNSPSSFSRMIKNTPDGATSRGPKVYNKNLPDVFLLNGAGSRKASQKPPQDLKLKERPQSSKNISIEGALHVPHKKNEIRKEYKFMSPPPQFEKFRAEQEAARAITYRKFNRGNSADESQEKEHNKGLMLGNLEIDRLIIPRVSSAHHRPNGERKFHLEDQIKSEDRGMLQGYTPTDDLGDQLKQLFNVNKMLQKGPKSKFFPHFEEIKNPPELQINKKSPTADSKPPLQLNELITLKKIRTTKNSGVIKRMLHVPTLKMLDLQEEPISDLGLKRSEQLKDWLNSWKTHFSTSKYLAHVYWCFWNSPEGCVSVLVESAKKGLLSDFLNNFGGLPENCIKDIAKDVMKGVHEVHKKLLKPHGNIKPGEIMITQKGTMKLMPGISRKPPAATVARLSIQKPNHETNNVKVVSQDQLHKILKDVKPTEAGPSSFAQDIFDLGLVILQCAIGDLSLYDHTNILSWEGIRTIVTGPTFQKNESYACCLIHSEIMVRKALMKNVEGNKEAFENNHDSYISLREILKMRNRFSDSFESFLCSCLKLNANKRVDLKNLATHKFLTTDNIQKGPLLNINDLLGVENAESMNHHQQGNSDIMSRKHLEKLDEALRVAFLNKVVKEKFDFALLKNQEVLNQKRLKDLAEEIGVPADKLEKVINECFANDYQLSLL